MAEWDNEFDLDFQKPKEENKKKINNLKETQNFAFILNTYPKIVIKIK
tara:strand:- start:273 stop:416 length:144 start_codon:yes stop_codon:yes gene_type:complete